MCLMAHHPADSEVIEDRHKRYGQRIEVTLLNQWRIDHGLSYQNLANFLGCNKLTVFGWCWGNRRPGLGAAFWIEERTSGGVPVASWLGMKLIATDYDHHKEYARAKEK